ncbi:MAG: phosphopantetheine adenylyltransferase [Candidatus Bathyarchaeia archaeon]
MVQRLFRKVAVGGTFDKLHVGHIRLLQKAFEVGDEVLIGLVTDSFLKKYPKTHKVATYANRRREVLSCLKALGAVERARVVPLDDFYGPTIHDSTIEAIVVSRETEFRVREINKQRVAKGLKPIEVVVVDMVLAEDNIPVSTTRIRRGEIDREGRLL